MSRNENILVYYGKSTAKAWSINKQAIIVDYNIEKSES